MLFENSEDSVRNVAFQAGAMEYFEKSAPGIMKANFADENDNAGFDPMADKILVISTMICFSCMDLCSPVVLIIVVTREFMMRSLRLVAAAQGIVLAAGWSGKLKDHKPDDFDCRCSVYGEYQSVNDSRMADIRY